MNPDNNFGNGIGQDNIGSQNLGGFTPSEPISPVGPIEPNTQAQSGETFSPFANLDAPQTNVSANPTIDQTPNVNSAPAASEGLFDNVNIPTVNAEPKVEEPAFSFDTNLGATPNVAAPTPSVEPVQTPSFDIPAEPVQPVAPVMETPNVSADATVAPAEPSPISDLENNVNSALNAALEMPVADEFKNPDVQAAPQIAPLTPDYPQAPTMPIPDQMPTSSYQAGVSTPVDYATPMSDFDQIGTTPELDPKAKSTKKSNKTLVFLLLLLGVCALGAGSYYLINVKKIFNTSSVVTKNLTVEKNGVLSEDINQYATFKNTSSSNCVQDTSKVDISTVGNYTYTIKCGEDVYEGKISVVDTTAPDLTVQSVFANVNVVDAIKPESFVNKCSEADCSYAFADESQISSQASSTGVKFIGISVTDGSGNSKTVYAPLVVLDTTLKYEVAGVKDAGIESANFTAKEKVYAFFTDNLVTYTVYEFKFNTAEEFDKVYKENAGNLNVTIDTISGSAVFDKDNLIVYIVPEAKSQLVTDDYLTTYTKLNENGYKIDTYQVNDLKYGFGDI